MGFPRKDFPKSIVKVIRTTGLDIGTNVWTFIPWQTAIYDTDDAYRPWQSAGRIWVPPGKTMVKVELYLAFLNAGNIADMSIYRNSEPYPIALMITNDPNEHPMYLTTGYIPCVEGDSYYVSARHRGGGDLAAAASWGGPCWFQAEYW